MMDRKAFVQQAKNYLKEMYLSHKNDEIDSWGNFIDVVFLYIDHKIEEEISEQINKSSI